MEAVSAPPPKGMLNILMFNSRRLYHAAPTDVVKVHLSVMVGVPETILELRSFVRNVRALLVL